MVIVNLLNLSHHHSNRSVKPQRVRRSNRLLSNEGQFSALVPQRPAKYRDAEEAQH